MLQRFEGFPSTEELVQQQAKPATPEIKVLESNDTYGKFSMEPLERGYGMTVGNPIRRVLLSSIPGTAVTWVRVDGILHDYSVIPNVKEDVTDIILNIKGIRIRSITGRAGKMRLEVKGEGRVCAGDISTSADFEVVNPELHILTLDSAKASISIEFNVEQGKGYQSASQVNGLPLGVLPVDAIFSPVKKVNYTVERTRVGQVTDYERLILEVWTDGTATPIEAVRKSAEILVNHFFFLTNTGKEPVSEVAGRLMERIPVEVYQMLLEKLELSPRTINCLKRAHINKVGEVLERTKEELLSIRNFGDKSLAELYAKLRERGLLPPEREKDIVASSEASAGSVDEEAIKEGQESENN